MIKDVFNCLLKLLSFLTSIALIGTAAYLCEQNRHLYWGWFLVAGFILMGITILWASGDK